MNCLLKRSLFRLAPLLLPIVLAISAFSQEAPPNLQISHSESKISPILHEGKALKQGLVTILESSQSRFTGGQNFDWYPVFASDKPNWEFVEENDLTHETRFYRSYLTIPDAIPENEFWKNRITLPSEGFLATSTSETRVNEFRIAPPPSETAFVKFTILLNDPTKVYYQNTHEYPFHYEFAKNQLPPFSNYGPTDFDNATLKREGQEAVLGAVIFDETYQRYGIQFVGTDLFPPEMVRFLFELVDSTISVEGNLDRFYMPTGRQASTVTRFPEYFAKHGITYLGPDQLESLDDCYAKGWAIGRLRYFNLEDVEAAFLNGELLSSDILVTNTVPDELPYLAGVLTLSPATPNSHVALLAQTYETPFAYIGDNKTINQMLDNLDTEVVLNVSTRDFFYGPCSIRLESTEGFDAEFKQRLYGRKNPSELEISPKKPYGSISENVATLYPEDIEYFGGKASNFGFLLREIPESTRPMAVAFSFDLWDAYLAQEIDTGKSLKQEIDERLSKYSWPVENLPALYADLNDIKQLVEEVADFSTSQKSDILNALAPFETTRKIRFRSSTNVEDSESFSGAGLYASNSGCLADEIDTDSDGPSACDPTKTDERGVFRAMRKVYASFYNVNAFLDRLRFSVDENQAGMAILTHYSYPDEIEQANGVITAEVSLRYGHSYNLITVSQPGSASVTNPNPSDQPEIVIRSGRDADERNSVVRKSGLLPSGVGHVLTYPEDYDELAALVLKIVETYEAYYPSKEKFVLDFEYKKVDPGILELKQVRELPIHSREKNRAILIGGDFEIETTQGQANQPDRISAHLLKSRMRIHSKGHFTADGDPASDLIILKNWDRVFEGTIQSSQTNFLDLPDASYSYDEGEHNNPRVIYTWPIPSEKGNYNYTLEYFIGFGSSQTELQFLDELPFQLKLNTSVEKFQGVTNHVHPVPNTVFEFGTEFYSGLTLPITLRHSEEDAILLNRSSDSDDSIQIDTYFYRPPHPTGITVGYTAPLFDWDYTLIKGLASEPIILRSWYSQTYAPEHHNFGEVFVFEPRLDPEVPLHLIRELEVNDIKQIYFEYSGEKQTIYLVGFDDQVRLAE